MKSKLVSLLLFFPVVGGIRTASAITASQCVEKVGAAFDRVDRWQRSCDTWLQENKWVIAIPCAAVISYLIYKQYYPEVAVQETPEQPGEAPKPVITRAVVQEPSTLPENKVVVQEPVVSPEDKKAKIAALIQERAEKDHLKVIEGNGVPGTRSWPVPPQVRIVAEGGTSQLLGSAKVQNMVFEIVADENLLDYFIMTQTSTEFRVVPQEGLLLVSYTPVLLRLSFRNLSVPVTLQRGTRVISVNAS